MEIVYALPQDTCIHNLTNTLFYKYSEPSCFNTPTSIAYTKITGYFYLYLFTVCFMKISLQSSE